MTDKDTVRLEAGSVVALRMYDLGRAVDVDALARAAGADAERPQFPPGRGGVRYARPPLELALEDVEVPLEDGRVFADATLRVFDFGIAAVALRVLVGGLDWDRFTERVEDVSTAVSGRARAWDEVEARVRDMLQRARLRLDGEAVARHVFVIARRFGEPLPLDEIIEDDYAAAIVSRDWVPLTSLARVDLLRGARVAGSDLLVTGEDRSFMIESTPGSGLPDVVEAALVQRAYYDLARASLEDVGTDGRAYGARARSGRPSRDLRNRAVGARDRIARADTLLVVERAGPLATMYAAARDRFRVGEAEAIAARRAAAVGGDPGRGATLPLLPMVVVALVSAIVTALLVVALS